MQWYSEGKENNKVSRIERKLRRMAKVLNKISKKYGFTYLDLYFIHGTQGAETINVRAKSRDKVALDSYAFIE
jgi:predicted aldo/keto reductase-like oxidoreductase